MVRENPMATGAGADRVQDGMRKAFGKPVSSGDYKLRLKSFKNGLYKQKKL